MPTAISPLHSRPWRASRLPACNLLWFLLARLAHVCVALFAAVCVCVYLCACMCYPRQVEFAAWLTSPVCICLRNAYDVCAKCRRKNQIEASEERIYFWPARYNNNNKQYFTFRTRFIIIAAAVVVVVKPNNNQHFIATKFHFQFVSVCGKYSSLRVKREVQKKKKRKEKS